MAVFAELILWPDQATAYAREVDALTILLLSISAFFSILIATLIVVFSIKYRRRSENERPPQVHGGMALEIIWTVIPLIISVFLFVLGARAYFTWARPPNDSIDVLLVGKQWMWKAQHLGGQREINQIHVPVGQPVKLTITSQDVIHSFFVPAFRIHQDAVPGMYTSAWFKADKVGTYHLFCTEYCGTNHAKMIGSIIVMAKDEFQVWLNQEVDGSLAVEGRKLFQKLQCVSCHSATAQARAPVLEELYGTLVPLQGGSSVLADETYLRESIVHPDARVVAGFQPIMPTFRGLVDEEEILQLIAFIKGLRRGETPPRNEDSEPPSAPGRNAQKGAP